MLDRDAEPELEPVALEDVALALPGEGRLGPQDLVPREVFLEGAETPRFHAARGRLEQPAEALDLQLLVLDDGLLLEQVEVVLSDRNQK